MIYIDNIRCMKPQGFDFSYAIVRSMKGGSSFLTQLEVLAPSRDLWYKYLRLKERGIWNAYTYAKEYVPQFLEEMKSIWARDALNDLYHRSKAGAKIQLCCFCTDETLCHRSIIAGLLQGVGADVQLPTGADYRHYYQMYVGGT